MAKQASNPAKTIVRRIPTPNDVDNGAGPKGVATAPPDYDLDMADQPWLANQGEIDTKNGILQQQASKASTALPAPPADEWTALNQPLQAQLAIGSIDDPYEREADRIADQVMRMSVPQRSASGSPSPKKVPNNVHEVLRSTGQPLDTETRDFMEPRFKWDFGDVRIHSDSQAAQSARDVGARAYTVGNDIAFGDNQYAPGTTQGRHLLAHELAHVVQQGEQQAPSAAIPENTAYANPISSSAPPALRMMPDPRLNEYLERIQSLDAGPLTDEGIADQLVIELAGLDLTTWDNLDSVKAEISARFSPDVLNLFLQKQQAPPQPNQTPKPRTPVQQVALQTAIGLMVENVGDRLLNALGTKAAKPSGSIFPSLISSLAGATVAGVMARLSAVIVTEVAEAAVSEFFTNLSEDVAGEIVSGIGDGSLDLETFVREWKVQQRTILMRRLAQISEGVQGETTDIERELLTAGIKSSAIAEVENATFREVMSLYLKALRETTYKRDRAKRFGDISGRGWAHIQMRYGVNNSSVHADLVGFGNPNLNKLSEAFAENGFDPVETGIPVILTISKTMSLGSNDYSYETWWISPNYGQLWTEEYMMYSDWVTVDRKAGGISGSTRRGKDQASSSRLQRGFGMKLPIPWGFGGSVAVKEWRKINVT